MEGGVGGLSEVHRSVFLFKEYGLPRGPYNQGGIKVECQPHDDHCIAD